MSDQCELLDEISAAKYEYFRGDHRFGVAYFIRLCALLPTDSQTVTVLWHAKIAFPEAAKAMKKISYFD